MGTARYDNLTEIHNLLYSLGVRARILGFFETACAVYLAWTDPDRLRHPADLYREVGRVCHMDAEAVEEHIDALIRTVWKSPEQINSLAGKELKKRPGGGEFIRILCGVLSERRNRD